jgi:hypothetical protein
MRALFPLLTIFILSLLYSTPHGSVTVSIDVTLQTPSSTSLSGLEGDKSSVSTTFNLMYCGNYPETNIKVQAMKFATLYINNMKTVLNDTRMALYPLSISFN